MVEVQRNTLVYSFPEVHPQARLTVGFQRTLRIPDNKKKYPLPPGLGPFPIRHVDDFGDRVPDLWTKRGGVILPMYQSEALWINFRSASILGQGGYPFLLKVAAGKINAVSGDSYVKDLTRGNQDYVVVPGQPWLDGYRYGPGVIRQFVAVPLGEGYSPEEQLTGQSEYGGLQLLVYPMKREVFERRFPVGGGGGWLGDNDDECWFCDEAPSGGAMALGAGGQMRQQIIQDPYTISDWDTDTSSRCYVHLTNSLLWRSITGEEPPTTPMTAKEYKKKGLPWFDYYSERPVVKGPSLLQKVKSVFQMSKTKGTKVLPENESVTPQNVVMLKGDKVRDGEW